MIAVTIVKGLDTKQAFNPDIPFNKAVIRYSAPGDYVLALSPEVLAAWPYLLQVDRDQGTRFSGALFMLPVLNRMKEAPGNPSQKAAYYERVIVDGLGEDIRKFRPPVIVIDDFQWKPSETGFKMSEYLHKIGFISGAMKNYRHAETLGSLHIYSQE